MALVTTLLPQMEMKSSNMKSFTLYRCQCCEVNGVFGGDPRKVLSKLEFSRYTVGSLYFRKYRALSGSPSRKMAYNGYAGSDVYTNKIYRRMDTCLVIPPPNGTKPRAIIKFLGGAFVGAVPEVTYSHLIELLAKEGYLIISVPYDVTFDHSQAAREVYERFSACLDMILTSGLPDDNLTTGELTHLPLYFVGHSNGALLQLLIGSYFFEKVPKANAIISFNNRPASEAVPYFEQFGPLVSQLVPIVESSPIYSMTRSASGEAWKTLAHTVGPMIQQYDQEAVTSFTKFIGQLPSVLNQVTQGTSEFKPTPSENRDCFKNSYNISHTLLVKFNSDAIDETDIVEEILKPRMKSIGGTLKKVSLSGNHLTPCIQDLRWQVGYTYTPADALVQGIKALSLNDTRVLAKTVAEWFKSLGD